jgi:hypothetical protein
MRAYRGFRGPKGEALVFVVEGGVTRQLEPRLPIASQMPIAFDWADNTLPALALSIAIIMDVIPTVAERTIFASPLSFEFLNQFIRALPWRGSEVSAEKIIAVIDGISATRGLLVELQLAGVQRLAVSDRAPGELQ